jgi:hypothetical protein
MSLKWTQTEPGKAVATTNSFVLVAYGGGSWGVYTDDIGAFLVDGWSSVGTLDTAKADAEKGLRDLCADVIKNLEKA